MTASGTSDDSGSNDIIFAPHRAFRKKVWVRCFLRMLRWNLLGRRREDAVDVRYRG